MNTKQATIKFFRNHKNTSPILRKMGHKGTIPVHATEFVRVSDVVPKHWGKQGFWEAISESADFTWGDANRTMITAEHFADHCERFEADEVGTTVGAYREWLNKIRNLGQMYIDLEN